jgi:hypothetical protein
MAVDGVRTAALVDIATGMIVRLAGEQGPDFPDAAAALAQAARAARSVAGPAQAGGRLDEISLMAQERLQVSRVLDSRLGEGLLLFADLDRSRANLALASMRMRQIAPAVLA